MSLHKLLIWCVYLNGPQMKAMPHKGGPGPLGVSVCLVLAAFTRKLFIKS